jgi:hypothetical protein
MVVEIARMKIALITTTIRRPRNLKAMAGPALWARPQTSQFCCFIACDLGTPAEIYEDFRDSPSVALLSPDFQRDRGYASSELFGWNCVQRRNIATLEALRWGADVIVSVDDDNLALRLSLIDDFATLFSYGPMAVTQVVQTGQSDWVDPGQLVVPPVRARGIPYFIYRGPPMLRAWDDGRRRVGVAQAVILGSPDVDATDNIADPAGTVVSASEIARSGIIVDPRETWTVFNSQATAFRRELAPCMMMWPSDRTADPTTQVGWYDDIFASLFTQRVMRETGHVVHFGPPFVWQQRNAHNLLKNLKDQIFGMEHVPVFVEWLHEQELSLPEEIRANGIKFITPSYAHMLFSRMQSVSWLPSQVTEAGLAWVEDCNKVMNASS